MDSLALRNDHTALIKEAERLRAVLSSKILECDKLKIKEERREMLDIAGNDAEEILNRENEKWT